jgi:hypothetical protein
MIPPTGAARSDHQERPSLNIIKSRSSLPVFMKKYDVAAASTGLAPISRVAGVDIDRVHDAPARERQEEEEGSRWHRQEKVQGRPS